jgi:hypothetical protein
MKSSIASAAVNWDRNSPKFIIIQVQPWQDARPTTFLNVKNSLNSDYVVVRPDHIFQLIREKNGLPVNGTSTTGGKVTLYQHCNYEGWSATFDVGNFNLAALQVAGVTNKDASSIKITPGYNVTLYQNDGFGGASINLTGDDSCLTDNVANGVNFNDQISSMVVGVGGVTSSSSSSSKPSSSASSSSKLSSSSSSVVVSSSSKSSSSSSKSSSSSSSSVGGSLCTSPAYVDKKTYNTGDLVQNVNNEYRCTVGGWCTIGGPYEPGVGWAWDNAWALVRSCK